MDAPLLSFFLDFLAHLFDIFAKTLHGIATHEDAKPDE
jgi:hypothetical protein